MSEESFVTRRDGTFELKGPLTFATVPQLIERGAAWREAGLSEEITIDLGQVSRADSAGLALMVEWQRLARENQHTLRFVNIPEQLRRLIRVSALENLFPLQ